jgi:hypothetical protein
MRKVKKEKAPVTVLHVQGGERNINFSAYGSKSLLLPTNQTLNYDGMHFQGESWYDSSRERGTRPTQTACTLRAMTAN